MSLYGRLNTHKLVAQSLREYLIDIQYTCDSLAICGHPINERQQIPIILDGVTSQFDNVVSVIHASRNPYDLASITFILLDDETRVRDQLFDPLISLQAMVCSSYDFNSISTSLNTNSDYA